MSASRIFGAVAFVAFVVLGIVWSSERGDALAAVWVLSFALVAVLAVWSELVPERRPALGQLWDQLPGPSKNPDDYR